MLFITLFFTFNYLCFSCFFCFSFFYVVCKGTDVLPAELLEKAEMPKVVFIGFGLAALLCLLLGNAALFAWFIIRKRSKGLQFYFLIDFWVLIFNSIFPKGGTKAARSAAFTAGYFICIYRIEISPSDVMAFQSQFIQFTQTSEFVLKFVHHFWVFHFSPCSVPFLVHSFVSCIRPSCSPIFGVCDTSEWKALNFMREIFLFSLAADFRTFIVRHAKSQTFLINFGLLHCTIVI